MIRRLVRQIRGALRFLPGNQRLRWLAAILRSSPDCLRTRSLGPADRAFGSSFTVLAGGQSLRLENCDFGLIREIFVNRCYIEPNDIRDARIILDLGANCGVFSLFAATFAPQANIFAIEAQSHVFEILQTNLRNNGLSQRVSAKHALVGGATTPWSKELLERSPDIPVWSAPSDLKQKTRIDFLKCDIEGSEYAFFRTIPEWFLRVNRFCIEYHGTWREGAALADHFRTKGFSVVQRPHGRLGYLSGTKRNA